MGSVGEDYKCPLCGRVGNGGYAMDGVNVGPICTGVKVQYLIDSCLDRLMHGATPMQIKALHHSPMAMALDLILGRDLNTRYPCLALQVAPWLVNSGD